MSDFGVPLTAPKAILRSMSIAMVATDGRQGTLAFRLAKGLLDKTLALLALPVIALAAAALLILNPVFNPGPLFFRQERMGRDRVSFTMWKFRTMRPSAQGPRSAEDGVETDRITTLGRILRTYRIDELPNFLNVLTGEMSVVGPRPDMSAHAEHFLDAIPHYHCRYAARPGITGLAQIEAGYAEGLAATARKALYDRIYVGQASIALDLYILLGTLRVLVRGAGAK